LIVSLAESFAKSPHGVERLRSSANDFGQVRNAPDSDGNNEAAISSLARC
jgi:hypothetical protein